MKRTWLVLGIVVLFMPMVFMGWLLLAARWPKMDAVTMRMPMEIRVPVATAAMEWVKWGKEDVEPTKRIIRLDPNSADAWHRLCTLPHGKESKLAIVGICQTSARLNNNAGSEDSLGDAEMEAGLNCDAEDAYTRAAGMDSSTSLHVREMGHAALLCGHLPAARAGFETALAIDDKNIKGRENDSEAQDIRNNINLDHEYLSVFWARKNDQAKAREECLVALPENKQKCTCALDGEGLRCTGQEKVVIEPEN